ncbi:hypothetical protein [Alkalithermobacter paradoxus]|uniref:Uncharacterized protein n=1 Tax=Alkalithermobacter paradoxus TaxID=29349 RepID=A0A1V4IA24_9FIRM|nr:hypothetical protein CLOTH_00610 [[Clostridium] thermoalcaliphilum]
MKKTIDEFMVFALVFPILLLILKAVFKDFIVISNRNIILIFVLSFVNIAIRNFLIVLKSKYNMGDRNFEFIRRIIFILIIGIYLIFR